MINKHQVNYVKNVLARGEDGKKTPAEVVKEIYRRNMDNRILNNLRQKVNEMMEDKNALISLAEFKTLWFTYFKGEESALVIYEMILPHICVIDKDGK